MRHFIKDGAFRGRVFGFAVFLCALTVFMCRPAAAVQHEDGPLPKLTAANFAQVISNADGPVLVEFKARWCPYCKKQEPSMEELARDRPGRITVYQVDVDDDGDIARDYDAHVLPTLIIINQGNVAGRSEGALYGHDLTGWVTDVETEIGKTQQDSTLPPASAL